MEFSEEEQGILVRAWLLARDAQGQLADQPRGQVLEPWAMPDAERLADAGWLEAHTVDNTDHVAFFWTRQAETALDINALTESAKARQN